MENQSEKGEGIRVHIQPFLKWEGMMMEYPPKQNVSSALSNGPNWNNVEDEEAYMVTTLQWIRLLYEGIMLPFKRVQLYYIHHHRHNLHHH